MPDTILAGDIGGTNSRLAVFDHDLKLIGGPIRIATDGETALEEAAKTLIAKSTAKPTQACFAVAGPVVNGRATMTNVARSFDQTSLAKALGIESVAMINDLVANACGIETLEADKLMTLLPGVEIDGNRAIVSPGTGLGEAGALYDGKIYRPVASEGGHAHYAPTTEREGNLFQFLAGRFQTVTWERVLSGPGIQNLFDFCRSEGTPAGKGMTEEIATLDDRKVPILISEAARSGRCEASAAALKLFARLLGLEAANMALKFLATGGVYLGGGIPPKNLPFLATADFRDAFLTHQTMGKLLATIPVRVILDDHTALEGAAWFGIQFGA